MKKTPTPALPNPIPPEFARLQELVHRSEASARRSITRCLRCGDTAAATRHTTSLMDLARMRQILITGYADVLQKPEPSPVFIADTLFLNRALAYLTPTANERAAYATGVRDGRRRYLTAIFGFAHDEQSLVRASGKPASTAGALIRMIEAGYQLHAVIHCHPGSGPDATRPSPVDVDLMGRIQNSDSNAIGLIFTRDGLVRFFTVSRPFEVIIHGKEAIRVDDHTYRFPVYQRVPPETTARRRPFSRSRLRKVGHRAPARHQRRRATSDRPSAHSPSLRSVSH